MDALIEVLIEIFGELIMHLLVQFVSWILSLIVTDIDINPRKYKIIKICIYSICLVACIVLLVLSFIYAKTAYALLASIFISINILILGIRIINKTYFGLKPITITTIVLTRISRITFYVLIFVFLNTLKTNAAKITIVSISTSMMFILLCIDIYRIWKYRKNKDKKELEAGLY